MSSTWHGIANAVVVAILCAGCTKLVSRRVVARVPSPDGTLEAILTETNGGATTSFGYDVSITANGSSEAKSVATLYGATRSKTAYGVDIRWLDERTLTILYLDAKSVQHVMTQIRVARHVVDIVLQSGIDNPSAPPGPMHANAGR
jgi:hypothetical protein